MSNVLLKDILVTVLEPGTPGVPGTPGSPGSPAWDEILDYYVTGVVGDEYLWTIGGVTHVFNEWFYPLSDIVGGTTGFTATDTSLPGPGITVTSTPIYGTVHVHTVIHHPAVAPVPPTPGTPGTPAEIATNYQLGWNSSADSIDNITGDGEYKFSIDANTIGIFTGLSGVAVGEHYQRLEFGLYFTDRQVEVWESGVHVASSASFTTSDVFTIRRLGPEIAYFQGSMLLYRSTAQSSGTLFAYADLYSGGDQILNASLSSSVDSAFSETTPGVLSVSAPQPVFWASEDDGLLSISAPTPRVWISDDGRVTIAVPQPTVSILGSDFTGVAITVPSPAVDIEGDEETPVYGILQTLTPYPSMYMSVDVIAGSMNISVPPGKFLAWDGDGILQATVPQPTVFMLDAGSLCTIFTAGPAARASIDAEVLPDYYSPGIHAVGPKAVAAFYSGSFIAASGPVATAAVAINSDWNIVSVVGPVASASLDVKAGAVATVSATGPRASAAFYSGSFIHATGPAATANLTGLSGTVAGIAVTGPFASASVAGFSGSALSIVVTGPKAVRGDYNFIEAVGPAAQFFASNDASYAITEAYAVTLNNPAKPVTRYTNYRFQSIVRFGNDYIGFGPNGAFRLSGADDVGTPIAWSFKFGQTTETPGDEFGQGYKKMNLGVYFDGRFTGTAQLSVSVDDGTVYTYSKLMPDNKRDTLRFVPGKGLRGFAWQFGLSGTGPLDVYRAEFLQHALARKVKHG